MHLLCEDASNLVPEVSRAVETNAIGDHFAVWWTEHVLDDHLITKLKATAEAVEHAAEQKLLQQHNNPQQKVR